MPFVRRDTDIPGTAPPPADELAAHIAALSSRDAEARWQGARVLAGRAEAVAPLAVALGIEASPRVRAAIMTALMRIGNAASVGALLPYLRSQDAGQRAAAIETLQGLPHETSPFLTALLADGDSDVRILATELARNFPAAEATRLLCGRLNCTLMSARRRSTCWPRSAPKMQFRCLSSAVPICQQAVFAVRRRESHRVDFRQGLNSEWCFQKLRGRDPCR
jgi:hypothetical protein